MNESHEHAFQLQRANDEGWWTHTSVTRIHTNLLTTLTLTLSIPSEDDGTARLSRLRLNTDHTRGQGDSYRVRTRCLWAHLFCHV
jgi:hypothetical protein